MSDWTTELQGAICTAWNADSTLSGCPLFYNRTYPGRAYPYAAFYLNSTTDYVCQGSTRNVTLQINIFSDAATAAPVAALMDKARSVLAAASLTMANHSTPVKPTPQGERVFINDDDHWQATIIFYLRIGGN